MTQQIHRRSSCVTANVVPLYFVGLAVVFELLVSSALARDGEKVYEEAMPGTVWIVGKVNWLQSSSGCGYLADKQRHLVVTCYHVIEQASYVHVYFPRRDKTGTWIQDMKFYEGNRKLLEKTGHCARGYVVAYDKPKDLAILWLTSVPDDAVELKTTTDVPNAGERLHVIGHPFAGPGAKHLWSYTTGFVTKTDFFEDTIDNQPLAFRAVIYESGLFPGNSGGPALNGACKVVAINVASTRGSVYGIAVHSSGINTLMDTVTPYHVVGIHNRTSGKITYQFRWGDGPWKSFEIPRDTLTLHAWEGEKAPRPQIRFDCWTRPEFQSVTQNLDASMLLLGNNLQPDAAFLQVLFGVQDRVIDADTGKAPIFERACRYSFVQGNNMLELRKTSAP